MRLSAGQLLHLRYEVLRPLGEGGMGRAYLVRDRVCDQEVALKIVRADASTLGDALKDEFARLRGVVHPHLAQVRDFGFFGAEEPHAFYTCGFVDGETLSGYALGRGWQEVIGPLADALEGLRTLHHLGVVHGDFKPANVLVSRAGSRGVLIDLSCSQLAGEPCTSTAGTPRYMAPERNEGERIDARADLYGVGATLARLSELVDDELPASVRLLSERLLQPSPRKRPSDVGEVLEVLGRGVLGALPRLVQPPALLGREAELATFERLLDALVAGQEGERVLLLAAADGMGASRLLQEMKWRAQLRCPVVEGDVAGPEPLARMLRALVADEALPRGVAGLVAARERIRAEPARARVLLLDDVHRLDGADRELWDAYLRSVEADDRILLLASTHAPAPTGHGAAVRVCELGALDRHDVARWIAPHRDAVDADEASRLTGGSPALLCELGRWLGDGRPARQFVAGGEGATRRRLEALAALSSEGSERSWRALGLLAAMAAPVDPGWLAARDVGHDEVQRLIAIGWAVIEAGALRLARMAEASHVLDALSEPLRREVLRCVAAWWGQRRAAVLGTSAESTCAARAAACLARAGARDEVEAVLERERAQYQAHPDPWVELALELGAASADAQRTLACASILERAGHPDRALTLLARVLRQRPPADVVALVRLQAGGCYLRAGRAAAALSRLRRCLEELPTDALDRARAADLASRALIKLARYDEAATLAREALVYSDEDAVCADLHDDLAVALGYLGDVQQARLHLRSAQELHARAQQPRALARSASYAALLDFRAGDLPAATRGFRRAWDLAERSGGSDLTMYAAQNLAVVAHQQGDAGQALDAYQRSLRMAVAMGETAAEVTARANLAKLYLDVGLFDRAEHTAAQAERTAREIGARLLEAAALQVRAEVALLRGDAAQAHDLAKRAAQTVDTEQATREVAEALLLAAEALLVLGRASDGASDVASASAIAERIAATDLGARAAWARGRLALARGESSEAASELDDARRLSAGHAWLCAEIEGELAALHRVGAPERSSAHQQAAARHWERIAASLPDGWRDAFWAHPRHRRELEEAPTAAPRVRQRGLERLVEVYRKISAAIEVDEVLACAIDGALELTGAERGLVILRGDGEALDVAAARNLHARSDAAELGFSTGVARRVIETGQPVFSADAPRDPRLFGRHSLHGQRVQSVLCAPIRSGERVLGALYLDQRERRGVFGEEMLELLVAFADQVAIALGNARLVRELGERTRELERGRRRIERLMRGQAERIDELTEQVRVQQRQLEHRYDYANIVGRSAGMQQIFSTLDRVIDVAVPVLIEGESGTGKELVAKAIHFNSARKALPFVTINCGAVPEQLLEAELFGWQKGAFTGAIDDREGLLASARGGTVFLDELGEMPPSMQVKLLRVLQERKVKPLGSSRVVPVDFRLVCATNRRLREEVARGAFREDLFYRVGVVELRLPPLRERRDDIPELVDRAVRRAADTAGRHPPQVTPAAMRLLLEYAWPGNVRELENVITKAVLLAESSSLDADDIALPTARPTSSPPVDRARFEQEEGQAMIAMLRTCRFNVSKAARQMGIPRATFYRKMQRYGLEGREE